MLFFADAWKKVGLLPSSGFQSLQAALDGLAGNLGGWRPPGEDAQTELHAQAAGLLILYHRDDATRTLTLVDFLPASPEQHASAERGCPDAAPLEPRRR